MDFLQLWLDLHSSESIYGYGFLLDISILSFLGLLLGAFFVLFVMLV